MVLNSHKNIVKINGGKKKVKNFYHFDLVGVTRKTAAPWNVFMYVLYIYIQLYKYII